MASLETLPPDQRAVLELVLRRGHSYDEIARLLSIDRAAVRARALAGFDALGPQTGVPPERRALIADYLLDQLPTRVSDEVRERIAQSPAERAWARVLASELAPLTARPLPEISVEPGRREGAERADEGRREPAEPADDRRRERADRTAARRRERPTRRRERAAAPVAAAAAAEPSAATSGSARRPGRPTSRRGGALLLGLTTLVVAAVIVVLIASSGGGRHKAAAKTSSTPASRSTTGTTGTRIVAQINLVPPAGGSKAAGIAEVLKQGNSTGVAIIAQNVAPNSKHPPDAYAVWLYNTPTDSHILGFVNPGVGANGRLQTAGALPSNAAHYKQLLVTLETRSNPTMPGRIVLEGALTGV